MAALGEAKARYDDIVRDVAVTRRPDGTFLVSQDDFETWRLASERLRDADDEMLTFLERSVASPAE